MRNCGCLVLQTLQQIMTPLFLRYCGPLAVLRVICRMLLAECPALPPRKSIMLPARLRGSSSAVARSGNVSSVRILAEKKKRFEQTVRWGGQLAARSLLLRAGISRTLLCERAAPPRGLLQRHRALSHASCGGAGGGAARGGGGGGRCAALRCAALRRNATRCAPLLGSRWRSHALPRASVQQARPS